MANPYFQFKQFSIHQEHCAMKVSTDAMILGAWVNPGQATTILDIGTGTGILALMVAQRSTGHIDAIDMDDSAYGQARDNVSNSPWKNRISVIHNTLQKYMHCGLSYDLLISNPPFFSNSLQSDDVTRNMARHTDSLSPAELLDGVKHLLLNDGRFAVIWPFRESKTFLLDGMNAGLYCNRIVYIKPSPHKKINRVLMEMSYKRQKREEDELIIRNEENTYTEAYKSLTRDYYLFF